MALYFAPFYEQAGLYAVDELTATTVMKTAREKLLPYLHEIVIGDAYEICLPAMPEDVNSDLFARQLRAIGKIPVGQHAILFTKRPLPDPDQTFESEREMEVHRQNVRGLNKRFDDVASASIVRVTQEVRPDDLSVLSSLAVHESGHGLGLDHCEPDTKASCIMNAQFDYKGLARFGEVADIFCPPHVLQLGQIAAETNR